MRPVEATTVPGYSVIVRKDTEEGRRREMPVSPTPQFQAAQYGDIPINKHFHAYYSTIHNNQI